ncbi:hypothetical protein EMIT036CA2_10767 [Chryseobacterium sp. IT-36CA2]
MVIVKGLKIKKRLSIKDSDDNLPQQTGKIFFINFFLENAFSNRFIN